MIIRLLNTAILAIVGLYSLELTGVVPARKYFPSLPRLEASATDYRSWLGTASWGVAWATCMVHGQNASTCADAAGNGSTNMASNFLSNFQNAGSQVAFLSHF